MSPVPQPRLVPDTARADHEGMDTIDPNVESARHPQEIDERPALLSEFATEMIWKLVAFDQQMNKARRAIRRIDELWATSTTTS